MHCMVLCATAVDSAPELDPATYGFHDAELDQVIKLEGKW